MNDERGAAGLMVLFLAMLTLGAVSVVAAVVSFASTRAQVSTAADLAALAGAVERDCRTAAEVAAVNGGQMTGCHVQGADLLVSVEKRVVLMGRTLVVTSDARAGPG